MGCTGRTGKIVGLIILATLGLTFVSVNLFPSVNNDGVDYIRHSQALVERGAVFAGYRQIGYPILLTVQRALGDLVGVETLLFTVFAQRALLLLGLLYAVWLWRWRAVPVALLVATPSFMGFTNLLMTEGLTIALALLLACLASHHFLAATKDRPGSDRSIAATATVWSAAACAYWMLLIRLPWAVFGLVPVAIWLAARRRGRPSRTPGLALLTYLVLSLSFVALLTVENSSELGVASPNARSERAAHWAAWQNTFTLHPENRTSAELEGYFNDGNPYVTIWAIEEANPDYTDQAAVLEETTSSMLQTAGLDVRRERFWSFLGALRGGRLDELRPRLERILATDAASVDDSVHVNLVSQVEGRDVFIDRLNEGHKPQSVITSPLFPSLPLPYVATVVSFLLPAALLGLAILGWRRRRWIEAAMFLVPTLVYSGYISWFLADNLRFLMTTSVYTIAGFCALWTLPILERRHSGASVERHEVVPGSSAG